MKENFESQKFHHLGLKSTRNGTLLNAREELLRHDHFHTLGSPFFLHYHTMLLIDI